MCKKITDNNWLKKLRKDSTTGDFSLKIWNIHLQWRGGFYFLTLNVFSIKKVPKFMLLLRFLNDIQNQKIIKFGTEKLINMNLKARKFTPHHTNYEMKINIDWLWCFFCNCVKWNLYFCNTFTCKEYIFSSHFFFRFNI